MFPQTLRHTALPLLIVAASATSAPANWFSDWFHAVSHEELPAPEPETGELLSEADRLPTLVPPYQSHRWAEEGVPEHEMPEHEMPEHEMPEHEMPDQEWPEGWVEEGETVYSVPAPSDSLTMDALPPLDALPPMDQWNDIDGAPTCCALPTVRYWNHPLIGLATGHVESTEKQYTILELANDCCPIQVPVTIPASCVGVPELETHEGFFGRTTHTFCWPCGYRLQIVRWGDGDLMVHTYNRPDTLPLQCKRSPSGGRLIEL